ncbi:antitermination regulator [Rhodoferax koreense]|uniref:Antitermination regulator n=1 Tax=Rhodoferax koreensis TaxID=1842727 RepID=A0A1P8K0A2_9BURK|nr:nitrate- and nitrite sensing domain-containing protein [Rhodoferax koreense]APW39422.1 antitermination regulator [Rhodoferax koreense]
MPDPAAPLSVATLVLRAKEREIEAVRELANRANLVDVVGQVIQALQRERGASSIYLASRGQRFADTRRTLVDEARAVEQRLREVFAAESQHAQGATARTLSLMAWALLGLDALVALRAQIERQAMPAPDAVAAYSHLIAGLIELVFHVADASAVPSVSRLLVAMLHLVQAQEEAGQERAVGALLYASGVGAEAHQQRVVHLIEAQERSLQVFAEFAEPALRARWDAQQLQPGVARLERLRRTLCTARPGAALDSNLSDTWFNVCTERIDDLWQLQVKLVKRLREDCAARILEAQQDLQDSKGLLRRLRDNPPPRTHVVDRFFDDAIAPQAVPARGAGPAPAPAESNTLLDLLQAQAARLAAMEAELDTVRRTLNERKVIERAKGMLMARLGMTEQAAFRALQKTSMDQNRRLLDVAEATLSLPDFAFAQLAAQAGQHTR